MKKAKVILGALVVLSIVGGALAFKAKSFNIYCTNVAGKIAGVDCPLKLQHTLTASGGVISTCTSDAGQVCVQTRITTND